LATSNKPASFEYSLRYSFGNVKKVNKLEDFADSLYDTPSSLSLEDGPTVSAKKIATFEKKMRKFSIS
jgi:hypothetical protein